MNIDIEENSVLLPTAMCEACILRRRKRSTRRNLTCCIIVAYNILVFSAVFVAFWYIFERLDRTEREVNAIRRQDDKVDSDANRHAEIETSLSVQKTENNDYLKGQINANEIKKNIRRIKRAKGGRKRKRCKNCLPVVQIDGQGGFENAVKSDLSGLWNTSSWYVSPPPKKMVFDVKSVRKTGKIKIVQAGLYMIYAQMNLIGPSVKGFDVFREDHNSAPECITSCKRNSDLDYTENCFTLKVVRLKPNCYVYIQEMETNSGSHYLSASSSFGLVKIGM